MTQANGLDWNQAVPILLKRNGSYYGIQYIR